MLHLQPHRVSVRSVTANRRTSRDAACTMIIGRDVSHLGPTNVKATNLTCSSAVISWLPANSNHQHVVCVNNVEVRTLKPGVYRHPITGKNSTMKMLCLEQTFILSLYFYSRLVSKYAVQSNCSGKTTKSSWSATGTTTNYRPNST